MKRLAEKYNTENFKVLLLLKRFLDDIFSVLNITTKKLHQLLDEINNIHPSINLTMTHTSVEGEQEKDKCDCPEVSSIPFLDTLISIKDGRIVIKNPQTEISIYSQIAAILNPLL